MAKQDKVGGHFCLDVLFWVFTPRQCYNIPLYPSQPVMKATIPPSVEWNIPTEVKWTNPGHLPVTTRVGAGGQAPDWFPWTLADSGLSLDKARKAGMESD